MGGTVQMEALHAVDTADVSNGMILALKNVEAELMGVPTEVSLVWVEDEAFIDVTFVGGEEWDATARYDLLGNRE
jgi:hypothetical protein